MIDYDFVNNNNNIEYDTREIHSRIITFEEYKKYIEQYSYYVPHINLTVDTKIDTQNYIALYDNENNKYLYLNSETGYTTQLEDISQQLLSFMVIDLNNYSLDYSHNKQNTNIIYGEYLSATNRITNKPNSNNNVNNIFHINDPRYKSIEFEYYKHAIFLSDWSINESIRNYIHYNFVPKDNEYIIWEFTNIPWLYIYEKNILISKYPYFTGLKFPIKNDSNFTTLITSVDSKIYKQNTVDQLYEKAIKLVSKKNIFENTPIKYINKLFDIDNYIDEYYDFGANSLKQVYITNNNKHGYDVTFSQYDLKIKIKPTWYNELCKLCEEQFPLNGNLVIDIDEKTDIKNINAILDDSLIYNKWKLPSNCMIILISEYKNLVEKCSNQNSTILKYTDTLFRSINNADDEGLYLSINYSKNKNTLNEDIRDDFLTTDDEYIVLEAGRESVRIKKENKSLPNIPFEFYEEFYLFPHRKKIEEHVRKKAK